MSLVEGFKEKTSSRNNTSHYKLSLSYLKSNFYTYSALYKFYIFRIKIGDFSFILLYVPDAVQANVPKVET